MEFKTPLKLPPRFHYKTDFSSCISQKTPPLSPPNAPRTTACEVPFARKSKWDDDFDPFVSALQKVMEENGGTNSNQVQTKPSYNNNNGPPYLKGSSYSRWVRAQIKEGGLGPKGSVFRLRGTIFRQSTRFVKIELGKFVADKCKSVVYGESKVKKLKGILQRYASFGREDNERVNQDRFGGSR